MPSLDCTRWHVLVPATAARRRAASSSVGRGSPAAVAATVPSQPEYLSVNSTCQQTSSRINNSAADCCSSHEAEFLGSSGTQSLAHWLAGREHQPVLAGNAAQLLKVVLDQVLEA